jgi:ABC-type nitrate/sulfonate/bicarbonate transport system ATPase subunit
MLNFIHVTMEYEDPGTHQKFLAIEDIVLSLNPGQFTCLIGPSGSGKSTLINLAAGFVRPTSGMVMIGDKPVTKPGPDRGVVFQEYALFPWLTVVQNVAFGLCSAHGNSVEAYQKAREMLRLVDLEKFGNSYPHQLSGGMKQRVALARAWVMEPDILLMDEPFGALDARTRVDMQNELLRLWEKKSTTILFVTHHVEEAAYLADRVVVFSRSPGRIVSDVLIEEPRPRTLKSPALEDIARSIHGVLAEATAVRSEPLRFPGTLKPNVAALTT